MSQDIINDILHIAWGAWIILCARYFPLWMLPVLAVIPRELEQTYHAIDDMTLRGVWEHISHWGYWNGKLRDLAGFLLGGLALQAIWR